MSAPAATVIVVTIPDYLFPAVSCAAPALLWFGRLLRRILVYQVGVVLAIIGFTADICMTEAEGSWLLFAMAAGAALGTLVVIFRAEAWFRRNLT